MSKINIYILGLAPLAVFQGKLRAVLGEFAALGIAVGYLIVIRIIAERKGK
ncbi:hypothetical protein [Burkholderia anthina]|uniref:hypothetical protein n=1 Tax=Burkholderia anthina TaxID=179879 RepID=UPI00158C5533|nr:hypothetical protein [Burkholderia anthina]